jgi:hypothetical protein
MDLFVRIFGKNATTARRPKKEFMNTKQKTNWWIDLMLFTLFITTFFLDFSGVEYHQWLGMLVGGLALFHLFTHLSWVSAVSQRFCRGASDRSRLFYLLDAGMLSGIALMVATGLIISTWVNLTLDNYGAWLSLHILISIGTLLILVVKLGLHWRWVAGVGRKVWLQPAAEPNRVSARQPLKSGASRMGRGDFLRVMSVVGAASFLAFISATKSLATLEKTEPTLQTAQEVSADLGHNHSVAGSADSERFSDSSDCTAQCGKHCSYPGHCRRYVDRNNNQYCDLGECL